MPDLNVNQLMMLRSLLQKGWPAELLEYLPRRCGASPADWDALTAAGLVEEAAGRWQLTTAGKKTYKRAAAGRWF